MLLLYLNRVLTEKATKKSHSAKPGAHETLSLKKGDKNCSFAKFGGELAKCELNIFDKFFTLEVLRNMCDK